MSVVFKDYSKDVMKILRDTEIRALEAYGDNWLKIADRLIVKQDIIDTGAYRESMTFDVDEKAVEVRVGVKQGFSAHGRTPENYAIYLELGTAKMQARPVIVPATEEANMGFFKTLREQAEYTGLSTTVGTGSVF